VPAKIFDGDAVEPAWSRSGARIAFMGNSSSGQRDLFTIAATGGSPVPVPVTSDEAIDGFPAWSSDGRSLYFSSDRGGVVNVWRIAIDEASGRVLGAPEPVTTSVVAHADQPSLSRDGSRLIFRSGVVASNPWMASLDLGSSRIGEPVAVLDQTGIRRATDVSPDGRWLAITNQGEAQEDIFICRVDGSEIRRLTDDVFHDRAPIWSPDGTRLAFYSNRVGVNAQIWTIKTDGSALTQVSDVGVGALSFPQYAPDASRIVATSLFERRVLVFDLSKPFPVRTLEDVPGVRNAGWTAGRWSPDGRRMLAGAAFVKGLGIYDFQTGALHYVGDSSMAPSGWLPDGRRVVAMSRGRLIVFDADSGQRLQEIALPKTQALSQSIVLAPDGRSLVLNVPENDADVWMAINK
jgi:Tol biopolymer transport system component